MDQAGAGAAAGITAEAITRLSGPLPTSCRCHLKVLVSEEAGSWMVEAFARCHPGQFRPAAEVQLLVDVMQAQCRRSGHRAGKQGCIADYLTRLDFVVLGELGSSHASL